MIVLPPGKDTSGEVVMWDQFKDRLLEWLVDVVIMTGDIWGYVVMAPIVVLWLFGLWYMIRQLWGG